MNFSKTLWRLVVTMPASGAWNMAMDEAILEAAGRGDVLPTLRLYAWQPACLSLGYAQPVSDVNFASLESNCWDLVRRPTGGRAILHADELTYSVTGPPTEKRLSGSVLESYCVLSTALLEALRLIDIPAEAKEKPLEKTYTTGAQQHNSAPNPVCFEVPSNYEITVDGKKLVGSAQARKKGGVLQHGSLPLFGDLTRVTQALVFKDQQTREKAKSRLLQRATTAERILNYAPSWLAAASAFVKAFENSLNLEFLPDEITALEYERAEELMREKYDNPEWTRRV